jgi:hypothetical protein
MVGGACEILVRSLPYSKAGEGETGMAESKGTGTKILLWGCGGCAGLIVIVVVFAAVTVGLAVKRAESEEIVDQVLEPELPPVVVSEPATETVPAEKPAWVEIDLAHGEYFIEPAVGDGPLKVEASFDDKAYRLEESLEDSDDYAFRYRVRFERTGAGFVTQLKERFGGTRPRVRVFLPRGIPIELHVRLRAGGSEVQLGGLWLTSTYIDFNKGGFQITFDEPLRDPMDELIINGSMGGFEARDIGQASPRTFDVDVSMGGMDIDLRGDWRNDSDITLRTSMGGAAVRLPRNVRVEGVDRPGIRAEPEAEVSVPTLRVSSSSSMGEIEFYD